VRKRTAERERERERKRKRSSDMFYSHCHSHRRRPTGIAPVKEEVRDFWMAVIIGSGALIQFT